MIGERVLAVRFRCSRKEHKYSVVIGLFTYP